MLAPVLVWMGFTRDSWLLLGSRILSIAFLIGSGTLPLDQYLPPVWVHRVTVGAFIVLVVSGHYGNSPLPGKKDLP